MRLAQFFPGEQTKRDAPFQCIGLLYNRPPQGGMLSFVESEAYIRELCDHPRVSAVITTEALAHRILSLLPGLGVAVSDDPKIALTKLHNSLSRQEEYAGKPVPSRIGPDCRISPLAQVDPYNVVIGAGTIIEAFCSVKEGAAIGSCCRLGSHNVIGGQSLEVKRAKDGSLLSSAHCGGVIIGDRVEIGQLNSIDRAVFPWDATVIGDDCRIGSQAHIAHCVKVGKRVVIPAGEALLGSCIVEDDAYIGPNAVISNFIRVGRGARVSLGAVAVRDVPPGETVSGNFAIEHGRFLYEQRKLLQ